MLKDARFELRIEKAEYQRFRTEADRRGLTVGELVREGVRQLLQTNVSAEKEGGSDATGTRTGHVELGAAHPEKTRDQSVKTDKPKGHDTEACRLYGCLLCRSLGVKNPQRGLT